MSSPLGQYQSEPCKLYISLMEDSARQGGVQPCLACGAPWLPDLTLAFGGRCSASCWEQDLAAYLSGTEQRFALDRMDTDFHEGR